jgi:hypothetical protein
MSGNYTARYRPLPLITALYFPAAIASGTLLFTGFTVRKYAHNALISESVSAPIPCHGIGGRIMRPDPMCFPVRMVAMNVASVHAASPVESGVRFEATPRPRGRATR